MTDTTPRAGAPLLAANQAQKNVTHNEALYQFDALLCARFLDRDLSTPPPSPADGDTYLIKATGTGAWLGQDGKIAFCADGSWRFYAPFAGLVAYVTDERALVVFDGSSWVDYGSILALENVPMLGVNTTADSTNKLAAKSAAILFDNIGNGTQLKLNKNASTDTASVLYQTAYSGRAEFGLTGDDNFHFKVSSDGSTWHDGFDINKSDGSVDFLISETTLASAATTDLGTASSLTVQITGTTAITRFGAVANQLRLVRFAGALTLTHDAAALILLGGVSRTTAAGDVGIYTSDATGNWRERGYCRAASDPGDMAIKTGTKTNDNAAAGRIGEYISSNVSRATGVSVLSGTGTNITSISLTAGDWDISALFGASISGANAITAIEAAASSTSLTIPAIPNNGLSALNQATGAVGGDLNIGVAGRMSLSATTTVYLVGLANFAAGTCAGYGFIGARRAR